MVDFRTDYSKLRYASHTLPDSMREALLSLNRAYHLVYSAIDLVVTPDDQYVFLEVNSVGQFGWLEGRTGVPLYHTLAKLLGTAKK
jgi:glutathione synthase/RimK-type ligase-like ATP-grasp enzyme